MAKQTEEERIKAVPGKEMLTAIKSMNIFLGEKGKDLVVFEKQAKNVALSNLLAPIVEAIEAEEGETLPDDVIAFYNTHLVVEEEAPAKPKKAKKEAKPKAPKKPSNEQVAYDMVVAGKSDADIKKHFEGVYAGKDKNDAFISKRAGIYTNIAKRKFASEDKDFATKWEAEKEAAKPKKVVKEKVAPAEKAKPAKAKAKAKTKVAPKVKK